MNIKHIKRICAQTLYGMVIAAMVFSVTGVVYAQDEEIPPPRIYANLTDDSIRYEFAAPYDLVTFEIYASQEGELLRAPINKFADDTGFAWISIWEHQVDLKPGMYIVVSDGNSSKQLVVEPVSLDAFDPVSNILQGTAAPNRTVWVVANNESVFCGVNIEIGLDGNWKVDFDDYGCDPTEDMWAYAQVMDAEDDTTEVNPNFVDGWHDGAEGIGHANSCNVSGFALDTNDRERDLQVSVLSDGMEVASTSADFAWDDLKGVCGDDGSCGFYVNLWGLISNYEEHQITVQAYDEETEAWMDLGGTPRTLTCVNYDLYVLNVKTGEVERLTTTLENTGEYNPSWSNDGKKVVHDVADADSHNLYITDVKTHISTPLKGGEGGNDAVWSPNGKWIVFDRRWYDDPNLYLLPSKGGTPQLVVENAVNGDWSPDGQRLVFERSDGIWTASVGGDDENQVAEAGYSPVWSPDGMWIAYDIDGDIWKIEVNEYGVRVGDPIQLTSGLVGEAGPTWSQNGGSIAFISDASGDYDIWKIPAEGGMPVQLRGAIGFDEYDPAYSNNGQYIAYEGASEPSTPHVEADAWQDSYVLADWPTGQAINVSIDDPGTSKKPDYRTTFTPDGSTNGNFFQPGFNIEPGFVITAASKFFTKTLTVTELAATDIDAVNGIVAGIAPPNSEFYMVTDGDHFQVAIGENVTADENGEWIAYPSEYAPWTWYTGGEMWQWDDDGDITHARWHVSQQVIEVWLRHNEIRAFDWPLTTELTFSVYDPEADTTQIFTAWTEPLTWMNGTGAVVNAGDLQLEPGMTVSVTDGTTTKELIIQDIRITDIDIENDIVHGYAPGNANLELGSWEDSPVYRFFNADEEGNWMVDYREPSLNGVTVDLNPGDDLRLFMRDDEKDATVWEAYGPNTRFTVWPEWNYLEGYEWPDGVEISISVAGKEACSTTATSAFPESDPWNTSFSVSFPEDCYIAMGDFITLSFGSRSLTHQVQDLTITEVNIEDDTVTGTATFDPEQYFLHTWINGIDGAYVELPAQSGNWLADFSSLGFDLQLGMGGRVELVDLASNATAVEWYIPNPRLSVRANVDLVEGWEWNVGEKVTLVIDNPGTPDNPDYADTTGKVVEVASWNQDQSYVYFDLWNVFDIQPGFEVSLSNGSIVKTTTVTDLAFTDIDLALNLVTGIAAPDSRVDVWACDNITCINRHINANDAGIWTADFGNFGDEDDEQNIFGLVPGTWIDSSQADDDNDQTFWGEQVPNPYIEASSYSNWVHAREWPIGAVITLTISGSSETYTATMAQAPWNPDDPNDIVANFDLKGYEVKVGDVITATGNNTTKVLTVSQLEITDYDLDADTISGVGTAGARIQVCANVQDHCITRWVTADGDGNWMVDYKTWAEGDDPETFDVQPGSNGWAGEYESDSDRTWFDWQVPNPRIVASITEDWFFLQEFSPSKTLSFTVYQAQGETQIWSGTTTTDESGFAWIDAEGHSDLEPGVYLVVEDGINGKDLVIEGFTFDVFDLTNGHLEGTAPEPFGSRTVWVGIGFENEVWDMQVATDGAGAWSADFDTPVPSNYQWVAAQTFDNDGDATELRPASQIIFLRPACGDTYTVQAGSALGIRYGSWVAIGEDLASQNAAHLTVELTLNGELVTGDQQPIMPASEFPCGSPPEGAYGVYYIAQVEPLRPGEYAASVTYTFDESITDGYDADGDGVPDNYYGPDDVFTREFTIIVP